MSNIKDELDLLFGVKKFFFKRIANSLFRDVDHVTPIDATDLPNPGLNSILLQMANLFIDPTQGHGIVSDVPITEKITKTIIWCDLRKEIVSKDSRFMNFECECSGNGEVTLTFDGVKMSLDQNEFHGITPNLVKIKSTVPFLDKAKSAGKPLYVDIPLKNVYLPLVEETPLTPYQVKDGAMGKHIEYSLKLKGRDRPLMLLIPVIDVDSAPDGTLLLWPKFKIPGWNAYYLFCDIDCSLEGFTVSPILVHGGPEIKRLEKLPPVLNKSSKAITLNESQPANNDDGQRGLWKEGRPRFLAVAHKTSNGQEELGNFSIQLEETNIQSGEESWGLDFGTQGSIVSYYPRDGRPTPLYLREDLSFPILQGDQSLQESVRNSCSWFPTYPSTQINEDEPYVLTHIATDKEETINRIYDNSPVHAVENFNIVSLYANTEAIQSRVIKDLKWPGSITSSNADYLGRRSARKGYLSLLLLMALAERVSQKQNMAPTVRTINIAAAYPLRMGVSDLRAYEEDLNAIYKWVSNASGFNFNKRTTISESFAASFIANKMDETIIADLGGGTLDLWMGKTVGIEDKYEISSDSVRIGGLNFLKQLENVTIDKPLKLNEVYLRHTPDQIGGDLSQHYAKLINVYAYYSFLVKEYTARFIIGHIYNNYERNDSQINVELIAVGNGWKLFSCFEPNIKNIHIWAVNDIQKRIDRIAKEYGLKINIAISPKAYHHKKQVSFGAASSLRMNLEQKQDHVVKTAVGIDIETLDAVNIMHQVSWTSRIPFSFSEQTEYGKHHVFVRASNINQYFNVKPEIPEYKDRIDMDTFQLFHTDLVSAHDTRLYFGDGTNIQLKASPFGLLCEKILNSFSEQTQW